MDATADFSVTHAFVLEPEQARKVCKLLQDRISAPSISVRCADNMVREFSDVKRLLDYENARDRRILSLIVSARTEDLKKQARISFASHSWGTIAVSIEGFESSVSRLKDGLGEIIDGTKPWYWRFAKIDFFYIILVVALVAYSVLQIYVDATVDTDKKNEFDLVKTFAAIGITTGILGFLAFSVWGLNRLRHRYFPFAVFLIGQEAKRYLMDEKIRWGIMIGFAVSLAASLVVAAITSV